jgi:hypothetical protein
MSNGEHAAPKHKSAAPDTSPGRRLENRFDKIDQ